MARELRVVQGRIEEKVGSEWRHSDSPSATVSELIDAAFSGDQGAILFRGAAGWEVLPPGTAGQVLTSGGEDADVTWETP